MKIVFDTYALMAYMRHESSYPVVRSLWLETVRKNHDAYLSMVNLGEVFYMLCRKSTRSKAERALRFIPRIGIHIASATNERVLNAARIKATNSLSYADAFAASLAEELGATLVTGDLEYRPLESRINILWL